MTDEVYHRRGQYHALLIKGQEPNRVLATGPVVPDQE